MPERERSFLATLSQEQRRALVQRARIIRVRRGQTVLARGEASSDVFIVQEGRLQVLLYAANGREVSLRDLGPEQLFGELAAIDGATRSVGIVASTEARLLAMSREVFREVIFSSPEAADWLLRRLVSQIRGLTDRVFELSALNVRARLHCELLRLASAQPDGGPHIEPAPTHAELAARIGTHREAVTRELGALSEQNIIRVSRRRLEFLNLQGFADQLRTNLHAPVGEAGWW
jgi:CRP/FNR family transcriptional regulator, cyclic AMP receptor protein